jgi:hypothetical protein
MKFKRHILASILICASLLFGCLLGSANAQTETATITGRVTDPSGAVLTNASVQLVNIDQGAEVSTKTNKSGIYAVANVQPGRYRIQVEHDGFKVAGLLGLTVNVQDNLEENFKLEVGSSSESVTVSGSTNNINTSDASVSTVIDHQFVENIPMNGRSFQTLVLLSPGVVTNNPITGENGQYSVNGQRTDANGFTVDGGQTNNFVDASQGARGVGGQAQSQTAIGTTQAMLMLDAMEEFRINTSTYSAEYGGHPGAEVSFRSRSGTNQYHGALYDYIRNSVFDSNNWFNDHTTPVAPVSAERQNDFGGTVGGPLSIPHLYSGKDRAFFFFAYEGLRLHLPLPVDIFYVPSNGTYTSAPATNQSSNLRKYGAAALQPILNSFPLPNCNTAIDSQCIDYGAQGSSPYLFTPPYSGLINAISARIDYRLFPSMRLFVRYADTTSSVNQVAGDGPYSESQPGRTRIYLLGADNTFGSSVSNELRLQYSPTVTTNEYSPVQLGGAGAPFDFFQAQGLPDQGEYFFEPKLPNTTKLSQQNYGTLQHQENPSDTLTWSHGKHLFKFGGSYLQSTNYQNRGTLAKGLEILTYFTSASSIINNKTSTYTIQSFPVRQDQTNRIMGFFGQDEWHLVPRLSLSLGMRWDINPAPRFSGGPIYGYTGDITNPSSLGLSAANAPLFSTDYKDFSPRAGLAYTLHNIPSHELVFHAGAGVFSSLMSFYSFAPIGTSQTVAVTGSAFPLNIGGNSNIIPALPLPPLAPYSFTGYPDHNLTPPKTIQWNVSLEQALGGKQSLTMGYVAALGLNLETEREYSVAKLNPQFTTFQLYGNGPGSSYQSLQVKYQRQISNGLQTLSSYTWSHAIDSVSNDTGTTFNIQRGSSDNDIRHNFTLAVVYNVPANYQHRIERTLLGDWTVDLLAVARSAFPYTPSGPTSVDPVSGNEVTGELNWNGQNPYVYASGIPGGKQLNPADFSITSSPTGIGDLPRNMLRAFGETQANVAIQRNFPLFEELKLQFRAEAFNLTNHPNFGALSTSCGPTTAGATCTNVLMGQATGTLNNGLGGLSSLYQQGGPRSLQFMLRLQF